MKWGGGFTVLRDEWESLSSAKTERGRFKVGATHFYRVTINMNASVMSDHASTVEIWVICSQYR